MGWIKLDDGLFNNRKVVTVSRDAKLLYIAGLCYAGSSLTDGFIPSSALPILYAQTQTKASKAIIEQLVTAGLWSETAGGYEIHDYLEHNQSSQNVRANREAARQRMQRLRSQDVRPNIDERSQDVREQDTDTDVDKNKEPPKPPADERAPDPLELRFARFWQAYPRKTAKADAWRAWKKRRPDDALTARMIAAVERQKRSDQWQRDGGQYIPHPATWLNGGRWEDEVPEQGTSAAPSIRPGDYGYHGSTGWAEFKQAVRRGEIAGVTPAMVEARA